MKTIIDNNEKVTSNSKQVEILKKNFPNCFDKEGRFLPDKLNSIINEEVEISNESYELNWLGKKYSRLLANQEVTTMLTEDTEHNSKPENINSQNLYLEGDNLEVLKHMVNSYSNQIKMIYIDPPYNTGTDFIYKDDRKFTVEELSNLANIDVEEAKRILEFTESNSNSHSAWLTFMYPRLYVARELLSDDGVIFISIDDNENSQLKLLCDEVFGDENYCANYVVNVAPNGRDYGHYAKMHENTYMYAKKSSETQTNFVSKENIKFKYKDEFGGFNIHPLYNSNEAFTNENRPNLYYPFYVNPKTNNGFNEISLKYMKDWIEVYPPLSQKNSKQFVWRWGKEKSFAGLNKEIIGYEVNGEFRIVQKMRNSTQLLRSIITGTDYTSRKGTAQVEALLGDKLFSFPKPVDLIKKFIEVGSNNGDYVLDFFSGSSTTAHAVMELNAEDNGNRKYIMVQLPEEINMKNNLSAYKFCTEELESEPIIPTIAKERIRRASKLIKEENSDKEYINQIDFGFKVFKTKSFIDTNYFDNLDKFVSNQTELLVTNNLSHEELADLLLTWKLHDGIEFTKSFRELMLDDYIVHYVDDKAYFMYKDFTNRNIIQLLEELDDTESDFAVRNLIVFATNFTSKEQRELVEAVKGYKNKKKIELNIELRY